MKLLHFLFEGSFSLPCGVGASSIGQGTSYVEFVKLEAHDGFLANISYCTSFSSLQCISEVLRSIWIMSFCSGCVPVLLNTLSLHEH